MKRSHQEEDVISNYTFENKRQNSAEQAYITPLPLIFDKHQIKSCLPDLTVLLKPVFKEPEYKLDYNLPVFLNKHSLLLPHYNKLPSPNNQFGKNLIMEQEDIIS